MKFMTHLKTLMVAMTITGIVPATAVFADSIELLKPGQLSVATEGTYPPFSMHNDSGQLDGIDVRLTREVARRLGLEYKPVLLKFDSLIAGLQANQFDIIGSPMDITEKRREQVTFSDAWIESGARLVVSEKSPIKEPGEISGKTVGVLAGSTWGDLIAPLKPSEIKTYKSETDAIQDLINGNIAAVVTDGISASYEIKHMKLPLRVITAPLSNLQKAWSIKKGKPGLVQAINKAIAEIIADGTYARLTADYLDFDAVPKNPIRSNL